MPSGARTQPQFSGHTYRFNRSKRVVHAKPRSATSIIRGGKQVDHLGVEIVRLAGRDFAKPTRAIGSARAKVGHIRSEEHTSELQSLMRISYAVFCLKKKKQHTQEFKKSHINNNEK